MVFFEMAMSSYYSSAGGRCPIGVGHDGKGAGMTEVAYAQNIPAGQWHTLRALESGTVILEMKGGAYEPIGKCDDLTKLDKEVNKGLDNIEKAIAQTKNVAKSDYKLRQ